jgi:hypothetical protein
MSSSTERRDSTLQMAEQPPDNLNDFIDKLYQKNWVYAWILEFTGISKLALKAEQETFIR